MDSCQGQRSLPLSLGRVRILMPVVILTTSVHDNTNTQAYRVAMGIPEYPVWMARPVPPAPRARPALRA
jgi:hypothetical protein